MTDLNLNDNNFVQEALYDKFKKIFENDIENAFLNQEKFYLGDIGYLTSEIKRQGTKSGTVIKNVKLKFVPTKQFRRKINSTLLDK